MKYDGKFASRWRAKSPDALCAVSPLIHVGARAAQYKGNAAPGFTPCLPKLLFSQVRRNIFQNKKRIAFLRSLRRTSDSPPRTFSGCPRKATFFAVWFFWVSQELEKTLNRYSLPAIHVRRTGSRACCKMVPAFPHLGCTGQKPPRVFHAESLWLPRHSDLSGICRW